MAWTAVGNSYQDLIDQMKESGIIVNTVVEEVLRKVDRTFFCPTEPYTDAPRKIGFGATISAPHMHTIALQLLERYLKDGLKVLDVGSGSGYVTACLAQMVQPAGRVIGVEHIPELVDKSRLNVQSANLNLDAECLEIVEGDGRAGYEQEAPYDIIHIGAAIEQVPETLFDQLKCGGKLLAPIGKVGESQTYTLYHKRDNGKIEPVQLMPVRFVPLTDVQSQMEGRFIDFSETIKGLGCIDDLTDDSLLIIFSYLSLRDWLVCEQVSSKWNRIIKKQWKALKTINLSRFLGLRTLPPCQIHYTLPTITCKMISGVGHRCGVNMRELVSGNCNMRVHLEIFPILVALFPKLTKLHLSKCLFVWKNSENEEQSQNYAYFYDLGGTFDNLTDLSFGETFDETARQYHERETMELILHKIFSAMPCLKHITLTHNTSLNGTSLMSLPMSVTQLNIDLCRRIEGPLLAVALQKLSELTSLSLYSCDRIEGHYLQHVSCTIRRITLSYCDSVDSHSLIQLIETHPQLECIELGHFKNLDNSVLKCLWECENLRQVDLSCYLASGYMEGQYIPAQVHSCCIVDGLMLITSMQRLTHLDLNHNLFVTADMLYQISKCCGNLEVLNVAQLAISDSGAYKSLSNLRRLRALDISFNQCVDEHVLLALAYGSTMLEHVACRNCPDINAAVIQRIGFAWKNSKTVFQIY